MNKRLVQIIALSALFIGPLNAQTLQVGYTVVTADAGTRLPVGTALFTYTNATGVLVSQAGVGGTQPITSGRIIVDENGTRTGVAIANPGTVNATATLTLRDASGVVISQKIQTLAAQNHISNYISELFPSRPDGFRGTLSFDSDQPLAAIALREILNGYGEPLYTTLPVTDLTTPSTSAKAVFPHMAVGGGYTTDIVLLNPSATPMQGTLSFIAQDGTALSGIPSTSYSIPANGTYQTSMDRPAGLAVGWVEVSPTLTATPTGTAIFRFKANGQVMTEAGVPATTPTTLARIFVDNAATQTGVAIANPGTTSIDLTLTLIDANGNTQSVLTQTLGARSQLARFANELFPSLASGFNGVMEIRATGAFSALTLKLTTNSRGDIVLTTLPVADLNATARPTSLVFPQIAIGNGFSTQMIFINNDVATATTGRLNFLQADGTAMTIPLGFNVGNQFTYRVAGGGGQQLHPGQLTLPLASISVMDPATSQLATEVSVNEGASARLQLVYLDTAGRQRNDVTATFASANTDVAQVDAGGNIQGNRAGFSTLTISAEGVVATATIAVVKIVSGPAGFQVNGIVQDLANRLYLASTQSHTILLATDLTHAPTLYAGVNGSPGLSNGSRLAAKFNSPGSLAMNQSDGSLFVADSANNVIRRILPGSNGSVTIYAGTGTAGNLDGPIGQATFNNPQGIALDGRGSLWVVDSGNQSIRRIHLQTGIVDTVAGASAGFRSPTGIAVEQESVAAQLDRQSRGDPPPPVSVIVADTGNGLLRRVVENGTVTTVVSTNPHAHIAALATFDNPTGVLTDALGDIFVTEPSKNRVRAVLPNTQVVTVGQSGTFNRPVGMFTGAAGQVVVADATHTAQQVSFGAPQISSISPAQINSRSAVPQSVTITGNNFSSDSVVVVAGQLIKNAVVKSTQSISFSAPSVLESGVATVTIQNRGGLGQGALKISGIPLSSLPAGSITTIIGGTTFSGDGGSATSAVLAAPRQVSLDSAGNVYFAEQNNNRIRRIDVKTGIINTIAGNGDQPSGASGSQNGLATAVAIYTIGGVAVDAANNVYISEINAIGKVDAATGLHSIIAGSIPGFSGDGGPATSAQLNAPAGLAIAPDGNLYFADSGNNRIRKISLTTGIITTVVGSGLSAPNGVAFDSDGNMLIADTANNLIRKVDAKSGIMTTVAGAAAGALSHPSGVAADASGGFYIADFGSSHLLHVDAAGALTTILAGDTYGVAVDSGGNVLMTASRTGYVYRVVGGTATTIAGSGSGSLGDNGPAQFAVLRKPQGMAVDGKGNVLIGDTANAAVRWFTAATSVISRTAGVAQQGGSLAFKGIPAIMAAVDSPVGTALDAQGNLYFADFNLSIVRRVDASGIIRTLAGTFSASGFSGDGGLATAARLNLPTNVAVDSSGNVYIADTGNNRIRRVAMSGIITTVAGNGSAAFSGDGGPATQASLNSPRGMAFDLQGNLLIADYGNARLRKVNMVTGVITSIANPTFVTPVGIAVDSTGNIYVVDSTASQIIRISGASGSSSVVAGVGNGFSGDGGPATAAVFNAPQGIGLDAAGNVYILDTKNSRIRVIKAPLP